MPVIRGNLASSCGVAGLLSEPDASELASSVGAADGAGAALTGGATGFAAGVAVTGLTGASLWTIELPTSDIFSFHQTPPAKAAMTTMPIKIAGTASRRGERSGSVWPKVRAGSARVSAIAASEVFASAFFAASISVSATLVSETLTPVDAAFSAFSAGAVGPTTGVLISGTAVVAGGFPASSLAGAAAGASFTTLGTLIFGTDTAGESSVLAGAGIGAGAAFGAAGSAGAGAIFDAAV